ncbi:hypothetical protein [Encephalitozoon cuniculi GB-M1]|uniref:Uncharacterized protein n=1 Tax=Encephalitozoon cuniculi (strain GB-M1) TaxID=284813 RepID=Q8SW00_ENCCU|nr:uncharacterized protein ECU03_1470 [Encephalitozoon cuniculi GB-M1]CAD26290.1 hypothetical protein [Encephalitozoon cuniculi GB-M1]
MYIRVSGINKMINRHDLSRVFTFTRPIYWSIEHSSDTQLYFYSTLHEIAMAQMLDNENLIDCLEVSLVEVPLKEELCSTTSLVRNSCCLYAICSGDVSMDMIEGFFGLPVRCYLRGKKSKEVHIIEFREAVEIRKPDFMEHVSAFEDYLSCIIEGGLYDCK